QSHRVRGRARRRPTRGSWPRQRVRPGFDGRVAVPERAYLAGAVRLPSGHQLLPARTASGRDRGPAGARLDRSGRQGGARRKPPPRRRRGLAVRGQIPMSAVEAFADDLLFDMFKLSPDLAAELGVAEVNGRTLPNTTLPDFSDAAASERRALMGERHAAF